MLISFVLICDVLNYYIYLFLQRVNDSLMICAEPDDFTVGEFITVGLVVAVF